jgi:amidase
LNALRVATWFDDEACPIDAEYHAMLRRAADALADAGARVVEAHPPVAFRDQIDLYLPLIAAAVSPSFPDDVAARISGTHLAWLRHAEERAGLRQVWVEWFDDYDVLLAPAWCTPAFEHDHEGDMTQRSVIVNGEPRNHVEISHWLMIVNLTNQPAVVVPIGRTKAELPVGMQIVAPYLHDRRAIRVAELVSPHLGGYEVPPGF